MLCRLCRKYNKRPFNRDTWNTHPCNRLRLQSIISREQCAAHRDSVKLEAESSVYANIASAFNPPIPSRVIEQAFSCLYFLTRQRIAHTTNYEPLLDLVGLLGVDIKSKISIARNATYMSDRTVQEMVFILSEVLEQQILSRMKESEHFALLFDETTDCTVTEQLAIHVRFIDNTGELKSHYLKLIDVLLPEYTESHHDTCISVGAQTICSRIQEFVADKGLDMTKMRGIGTDGAATMIGRYTGVVTRLKAITPTAIGVHCAAHRLNLASTQAADSVKYVKNSMLFSVNYLITMTIV